MDELVQDRDRDGRISYEEFCGKKTVNEKAFEVLQQMSSGPASSDTNTMNA